MYTHVWNEQHASLSPVKIFTSTGSRITSIRVQLSSVCILKHTAKTDYSTTYRGPLYVRHANLCFCNTI